jgi:hypothetical protein
MTDISFRKPEFVLISNSLYPDHPTAMNAPIPYTANAAERRLSLPCAVRRRKRARQRRKYGRKEAGGTKKFGGGTFWLFALVTH